MCAICGVLSLDPDAPVAGEQVVAMRDAMSHRGPDDAGLWLDRGFGLGHRRLSIIDLAGGHQPMTDSTGRWVIVFNGEIYNFREIRNRLAGLGHIARTQSDTEVIVEAWARLGEDECLRALRGIFAFAIWDRVRRRLVLVRDHVGVKPLYWTLTRERLLFASEIKGILQFPEVPRAIDELALRDYLRFRYVPGPRTMFRGIEKLQPGHLLEIEDGRTTIRRWWDLPEPDDHRGSDPAGELLHRLDEAVRQQLVSDVPLGSFLSGGIDSSAVVALMAGVGAQPVETFSIGYPGRAGAQATEFDFARLTASRYSTRHHEQTLDPSVFWGVLEKLVWHFDEPVADPAAVPLYFLARAARREVKVVLSGEGADEILGGYTAYRRTLALNGLARLPGIGVARRVARAFAPRKAHRYLDALGSPAAERYARLSSLFAPEEVDELLAPGVAATRHDASLDSSSSRSATFDPLRQMLYSDLKTWLPDDLLVKADKMTMASSLELRVPFLDHHLVEWAWGLPHEWKLRHGRGKWALREAVRHLVPQPVLTRPKLGFPVPIASWFASDLGPATRELLLGPRGVCRDLLRPEVVEEMIGRHERRETDLSVEVFALATLAMWHRIFIASDSVPATSPGADAIPSTCQSLVA